MRRKARRYHGKVCKKHPELKGLRYSSIRTCLRCTSDAMRQYESRKRKERDERFLLMRRLASRRYRQRHRKLIQQRAKKSVRHPAVLERKRLWARKARNLYPERFRLHDRKKYCLHKDKIKQRVRLRVARCKQALPTWADRQVINAIYAEARRMNMTVDHIVPLRGTNVCGLHIENNLQLLSRADNARKGNRFME